MYDLTSANFQIQMEHVTAKKPKSSPSICGCVLSANRTFVQIFMRNWCGKDLNFQKIGWNFFGNHEFVPVGT